jgi:hypothetical protein
VQIGLYHEQLKRYFELFEGDQLKVYLYEDFSSDPYGVLRDIFGFLGVDGTFVPQTPVKYNVSGIPKNRALHSFLQKARRARPAVEWLVPKSQVQRLLRLGANLHNRNLTKARLSPEVRRRVTDEYFREDILKLQGLIRRDLSAWLG